MKKYTCAYTNVQLFSEIIPKNKNEKGYVRDHSTTTDGPRRRRRRWRPLRAFAVAAAAAMVDRICGQLERKTYTHVTRTPR